ncbi:MAG: divalent-cation tolerance protein CutA, partial [Cyanobacteria bacterium]|nr:divalent-cation tolerance protein CutA [Cyanobacteriota bacterium]
MTGELVALVSCPPDKAHEVASRLVEARLAACVNVVSGVSSVYRWEGKVTTDEESLLVIKT